jgi:5-methylcytosine-specific restriction endonuclease McrA
VDHIIPLSKGGDDTRANVQLACWGCNSAKSDGGADQLLLFG